MDALFDVLSRIEPMHWFAIGLAFLVAEVATGTTYLLWPAAAAALTAAFALLLPGAPVAHWAVFALLTLGLTLTGHFYVRGHWLRRKEHVVLNERAHTLVGQNALTEAGFVAGVGRVRLDDTVWRATSADEIAAGERVEVVAVEGSTLVVKRA